MSAMAPSELVLDYTLETEISLLGSFEMRSREITQVARSNWAHIQNGKKFFFF